MGYRSDVGLCITEEHLQEMIHGDLIIKDLVQECLNSADSHFKSQGGEDATSSEVQHLFLWSDIKWYEENEDIAALHKRLRQISEDSFMFIRIGEDSSDIEELGHFYVNEFGFRYVRQLAYDTSSDSIEKM
jgi:hypothetical protein